MIGNVFWSIADVLMSMIVHRMQKPAMAIAWYLGFVEVLVMLVLYLLLPVEVTWVPYFAVGAVFAYVGMLSLFTLLERVDVSVSSAAWVFLSIGIALGGFIFFDESWTLLQTLGAVLSLSGVLLLSFWHHKGDLLRTVTLLAVVGFAYVPYFLIQKAALLSGVSVITAFFWPIFLQKVMAALFPLVIPSFRKTVLSARRDVSFWFVTMLVFWVSSSLLGVYLVTSAYNVGHASLVGIAENGQPFFLIAFAWVAVKLFPKTAPKEVLTAQSVQLKVVSFCVVFTGLALLAI